MNIPYWKYETIFDNNLAISIRVKEPYSLSEYNLFKEQLIEKYKNRIIKINKTNKFHNNQLCTIIYLNSLEEINYPQQHMFAKK